MKKKTILIIIALGLLSGCSSKLNFYQLHPESSKKENHAKRKQNTIIGIAEVEVAEYLQKPELVTRMSSNRIMVHDKDLWAGSFAKNIQSVIMHNISALLPYYTFLSYPWEEPVNDRYRIYVTIDRFDGYLSGSVTLQGRWSLVNKEKNTVLYSEAINYTAQGGKNLDELVDTQSRLIDTLCRHIAEKIRIHKGIKL